MVVANGENYPDAIVGSIYAAKNKALIVLSAKPALPNVVKDYVDR
ncbi:cell wall-binding repeat-containing protein [Peptostreptococcaceae bacterium OttesenSCG-928-C18]|nr:cell wall-binding repeat-containing protein [Peptostreptococcaceae bacterium OttesenSCG-928-C18]